MCDIKSKKKFVIVKTYNESENETLKKQLREKDEEIEKLKKQIEEMNKKSTRPYKYVEEKCCCGARYNKATRARHMRTSKHIKWVRANGGTDIIEGFKTKLHIKELPREEEVVDSDAETTNFKYPERCRKIFYEGKNQWRQYMGAGQTCCPEQK